MRGRKAARAFTSHVCAAPARIMGRRWRMCPRAAAAGGFQEKNNPHIYIFLRYAQKVRFWKSKQARRGARNGCSDSPNCSEVCGLDVCGDMERARVISRRHRGAPPLPCFPSFFYLTLKINLCSWTLVLKITAPWAAMALGVKIFGVFFMADPDPVCP